MYRCPLLTVILVAARRLPMHLGDVPTAVYQFVPNLEQHQQQCPPGQLPVPHEHNAVCQTHQRWVEAMDERSYSGSQPGDVVHPSEG